MIIKVDHLNDSQAISACRQAGVSCLGIDVDFTAAERLEVLTSCNYSDVSFRFTLPDVGENQCVEICRSKRPFAAEFVGHFIPTPVTCRILLSFVTCIIFSGIDASHDTDSAWILSRYADLLDIKNAYFQVDLLEETDNAWKRLKCSELSDELDELTVSDINRIAQSHKLLLNVNYTTANVTAILQAFPNACGMALALESEDWRRSYSLEQIVNIVTKARALELGS